MGCGIEHLQVIWCKGSGEGVGEKRNVIDRNLQYGQNSRHFMHSSHLALLLGTHTLTMEMNKPSTDGGSTEWCYKWMAQIGWTGWIAGRMKYGADTVLINEQLIL